MRPTKDKQFGVSEYLQSGMLITLITIAFKVGQASQRIESKIENHETRILHVETVVGHHVKSDRVRKLPLKNLEETEGFL